MAITIWSSSNVKSASGIRLVNGQEASVAVWKAGSVMTLRFKRTSGGAWPADADAVVVGTLTSRAPWTVREIDGVLYLVSGLVLGYKTSKAGAAGEWEAL